MDLLDLFTQSLVPLPSLPVVCGLTSPVCFIIVYTTQYPLSRSSLVSKESDFCWR